MLSKPFKAYEPAGEPGERPSGVVLSVACEDVCALAAHDATTKKIVTRSQQERADAKTRRALRTVSDFMIVLSWRVANVKRPKQPKLGAQRVLIALSYRSAIVIPQIHSG